jgi:hemerythrin
MLEWTTSLTVGVPEIDAQHRTLFERAADLETAVRTNQPWKQMEKLFAYLEEYARAHFESEERLMREVGYPETADHVHEHSEFKRRLASLVPHWESEGPSTAMTMALMGFLDGWLATHVGTSDQRFGVFLRERRAHVGRPRRARQAG